MPRSSKKFDELLHDIRSPLTSAIISCEEALKKDALNEDLNDIYESLKYIVQLISADAGDEEFDVIEVISSSIRSAKIYSHNKCEIKFMGSGSHLYGNRASFKRVINNLLLNSIEGSSTVIHIEVAGSTVIKIRDNGIGIPVEDIPNIFNAEFSTKEAISLEHGLGLSICKSIIEKDFGGQISVKSKTGSHHGTTFTMIFP